MKLSDKKQKEVDEFLSSAPAVQSQLEGMSVRLYNTAPPAGAATSFASGTVLFTKPGSTATYIVTSKEVLQLYNIGNARPTFDRNPGSSLDTLINNFKRDVRVVYGQTLWQAPIAPPPPANTAQVTEVIFKQDDRSWDYDLILLCSLDQGLYNHANGNGYSAWDASNWKRLTDMPTANDINTLFAHQKATFLSGFGDTPMPYQLIPVFTQASPTIQQTPFTLDFAPPIKVGGGERNTPLPANALQIQIVKARYKVTDKKGIKFWPHPPPGPNLVMNNPFKATRRCLEAAFLEADEEYSCVVGDTGGGTCNSVDERIYSGLDAADKASINKTLISILIHVSKIGFVGVISGTNGTTEGEDDWKKIFDDLEQDATRGSSERDIQKKAKQMSPFLPWPSGNQVVTLITDMLDYWPLDWPPAPQGYFTASQTSQAAQWIVSKCNNGATLFSAQAVINKVMVGSTQKGGWGATTSSLNNQMVYHASAGLEGQSGGVSIWFIATLTGSAGNQSVQSFQIYAIGAHSNFKNSGCSTTHYSSSYLISAIVDTNSDQVSTASQVSTQGIYGAAWQGQDIKINNQYCI
jgi:hypothetical protein